MPEEIKHKMTCQVCGRYYEVAIPTEGSIEFSCPHCGEEKKRYESRPKAHIVREKFGIQGVKELEDDE